MVTLKRCEDPELLKAAGRVAMMHGHLETAFRYFVATLEDLEIKDALRQTERGWPMRRIRERIAERAENLGLDNKSLQQLGAMLSKAETLSRRRNHMLHRPWSKGEDGALVQMDEGYDWGPAPTPEELDSLADEIWSLARRINKARKGRGFVARALKALRAGAEAR